MNKINECFDAVSFTERVNVLADLEIKAEEAGRHVEELRRSSVGRVAITGSVHGYLFEDAREDRPEQFAMWNQLSEEITPDSADDSESIRSSILGVLADYDEPVLPSRQLFFARTRRRKFTNDVVRRFSESGIDKVTDAQESLEVIKEATNPVVDRFYDTMHHLLRATLNKEVFSELLFNRANTAITIIDGIHSDPYSADFKKIHKQIRGTFSERVLFSEIADSHLLNDSLWILSKNLSSRALELCREEFERAENVEIQLYSDRIRQQRTLLESPHVPRFYRHQLQPNTRDNMPWIAAQIWQATDDETRDNFIRFLAKDTRAISAIEAIEQSRELSEIEAYYASEAYTRWAEDMDAIGQPINGPNWIQQ